MNTTETGTCLTCRRPLRSPASRSRGRGPVCARKARRAQIDAARELIEDAAIVPVRNAVFRAVSTDGTTSYLCHPTNCSCPAGIKSRRCYHQLAARLSLAA